MRPISASYPIARFRRLRESAALRDLVQTARKLSAHTIPSDETPQKVSVLLRKITGFSGLVHENMYRSTGWRFLSLGMSLERAANMAMILAALAEPDAPDGALDLLLEIGDSIMSHRARSPTPAFSAAPWRARRGAIPVSSR